MKKILLIEDNPDMRENTAEILELADYEVITAENGKEGVKLAKENNPDLIICDIMMPELDGYGVLNVLSKLPATNAIPFVFLSAKAERSDFRKGMDMGADDYLTKPFDDTELLNAVENRIKRSARFKTDTNSQTDLSDFLNKAANISGLEHLADNRKERIYKKKDTIFFDGDYPNSLFYVKSGKVRTYKMNEDGKEYTTGLYKENEFLGYIPLFENSNYSEYAVALEDCVLSIIPKDDFLQLVENNKDVSVKFIKMLSNNIEEKEEQLINLAYSSVRKRVAEGLILLKNKYKTEGENQFSISIARDDLASIVGTATESVIRTLSDFKAEKLIEIKSGRINILDEDKLKNLRY